MFSFAAMLGPIWTWNKMADIIKALEYIALFSVGTRCSFKLPLDQYINISILYLIQTQTNIIYILYVSFDSICYPTKTEDDSTKKFLLKSQLWKF